MDWTPTEIAALRSAALRMSLAHFARHVGVSLGSARNWERGDVAPAPTSQRLLDAAHDRLKPAQRARFEAALHRDVGRGVQAATVAVTPEVMPASPTTVLVPSEVDNLSDELLKVDFDELACIVMAWASNERRGMSRREALSRLSTALALAAVGPRLPLEGELARITRVLDNPSRVDAATLDHTETIILACRRQGDVLGPEVALQTALAQRQVTASLLPGTPTVLRHRVLSLYAELTQLAGWSLFNLGRYAEAQRYYEEARLLAHEAENTDLVTYVLCGMSQLATWQNTPRIGIDHAAAAMTWADTPHSRAYAADVAVKAYAAAGQRERARRALHDEREAVAAIATTPPASPWWYFYDEAFSLQTGALLALRFQEPAQAHQAVNDSLARIDSTNLHNLAFNLLYRAEAYLQEGEPQASSQALSDVAALACTPASRRIQQRMWDLRRALDDWRDRDYVRVLDEQLRELRP